MNTFTCMFRNITGVSYEYADSLWFTLTDQEKSNPVKAAFDHGRELIQRRYES